MTRADVIAVVLAVVMLPFLYVSFWGNEGVADTIRVHSVEGIITLPLTAHRRLHVQGPLGASVLEVSEGRVRFVASPCRGQQCVHSGWLSRAGDVAACLPNGVTVAVTGRQPRYDAINF